MGSRAMVLLRGGATTFQKEESRNSFSRVLFLQKTKKTQRQFSVKSSLDPPDVAHLAQTARISLTHQELEEFAPKIQQVVDWFGQLQAIDLESIEPSIRADSQGYNLREDVSEVFENRQAIVDGIPSFEEPHIKIPKVLNKE